MANRVGGKRTPWLEAPASIVNQSIRTVPDAETKRFRRSADACYITLEHFEEAPEPLLNRPTLPSIVGGLLPDTTTPGHYPLVRPRRLRAAEWSRRLVREHALTVNDLIWPIFIIEGHDAVEPVASMPGVERYTIDRAVRAAERAARLGIPCVELFPNTPPGLRTDDGREAYNPDNLVCRAIRAVKAAVPEIGVMCDVALDPYTSHGHDGLLRDGRIRNDESVAVLVRQALVQAEAGVDIVGPSDMMDGRVGAIRRALEAAGYDDVQIMSYAAKYASCFYGPFREAVGTSGTLKGDKKTYQMDPANTDEAIREAQLDVDEGADSIMVKPGLAYLDIVRRLKEACRVPVFAYQVSGEYSMLHAAAERGWLDLDRAIIETLTAFKRAGCAGVLTYFAPVVAEMLRSGH
jgi:porphobilinogen synthase